MALNDGSVRLWAAHPSTPTDFRQAAIVRNSGARASAVCVFAPDARHIATASTQPAARRPRPASGEAHGGAPKRVAHPEAAQRTSAAFGDAPARPPAGGTPPAFGAPGGAPAERAEGPRADEEGVVEVFPLDQQLQARARARAPARTDLGPVGGVERAFERLSASAPAPKDPAPKDSPPVGGQGAVGHLYGSAPRC